MKIAVINKSGNVGKTFFSKQVIAPRLAKLDGRIVHIESTNSTSNTLSGDGAANDVQLTAGKLSMVVREMLLLDADESMIIDIGGSEVAAVLKRVAADLKDFVPEIDAWVVPVTALPKVQRDTLSCIQDLLALGVPATKIVVVRSMVESRDSMDNEFVDLDTLLQTLGVVMIGEIIPWAEVAQQAGDEVLAAVVADTTDYKSEARTLGRDDPRSSALIDKHLRRTAAAAFNPCLDAVFRQIRLAVGK